MVHQPTVEYTPFETQEHAAPFGNPRDDEPRLVAARGVPRRDEVEDEVHAYAAAPRGDTAEHAIHDEEPEVRPPVPLRRAPERSAKSPRKRPAPNAPRRRPPSVPRSSGSGGGWGRRIFALVALIVIAVALYVVNATFQPFHGDGEGTVAVEIPRGADAGRVGEILAEKGVIDSARFFELNATISGDRGNLRPGRYSLKRGMTNGAAIDALVAVPEAPKAVETVSVTHRRGPVTARERAGGRRQQEGRGQLRRAPRAPRRRWPGSGSSARRRARRPPRASSSRPPTSSRPARRRTTWSTSNSTPSRTTSRRST